jgi:hypothetical protein
MILFFTCLAYLAVAAIAGLLIGYLFGRRTGRKLGRWDGLEEGYRDAMRDGWRDLISNEDLDALTLSRPDEQERP